MNKIHMADYVATDNLDEQLVQGVKFAKKLLVRLVELQRPFRLLLSLDPDSDEVTVRFFVRRKAQPWGADDVEQYKCEEVMQWDIG